MKEKKKRVLYVTKEVKKIKEGWNRHEPSLAFRETRSWGKKERPKLLKEGECPKLHQICGRRGGGECRGGNRAIRGKGESVD